MDGVTAGEPGSPAVTRNTIFGSTVLKERR
jgi:hypothetical protein